MNPPHLRGGAGRDYVSIFHIVVVIIIGVDAVAYGGFIENECNMLGVWGP